MGERPYRISLNSENLVMEDIMPTIHPEYWNMYRQYAEKKAEEAGKSLKDFEKKAGEYAAQYRSHGCMEITPKSILKDDPCLFYCFYKELGFEILTEIGVPSPVKEYKDSSWMNSSDYCFLNIRATSPKKDKTGTISDALKLLPVIRANSIHLAPFFDCTMDNLYAVDSLRIITDDIVDKEMEEAGLTPETQLRLLIDAIHILKKTVGFDLEPHTSQFSRVVMENPSHFRWLHLNADRSGLAGGVTHEEMFSPEMQKTIVLEVKALVDKVLKKAGLSAVEDTSKGLKALREAHSEALKLLIKKGYWTLPSHTWNGVGLPEFKDYNKNDNYPDFTYLDEEGEDQHDESFGMLTPFAIYTNLPFNKVPTLDNPPVYREDTVRFLTGIFPEILKRFDFDFLRIDYVDHVFDSTVEESWDIPVSDRMAPKVLKAVIDNARKVKPYLGAMAERMGQDIEDYRKVGFDLVLGQDILTTMHRSYLTYCMEIQEKLRKMSESWSTPASVLFALDTHDSGHPLFWTMPESQVEGAQGMMLRHFLSRFFHPGKLRRPKYEVMGNQDLSYGLYEANNKPISLTWVGDKEFNRWYHAIENIYEELRPVIENSVYGPVHLSSEFGFWFLDCYQGKKSRLVCAALLEVEVKKLKELLERKPTYSPLPHYEIDAYEGISFDRAVVMEYDLKTGGKKPFETTPNGRIVLRDVEPRGVRLFIITEA